MSAETSRALGDQLTGVLREYQQETAPKLRAIAAWWNWYAAIPKQKVKNFPFAGASNVVVPLIGITVDALTSRSLAQLTAAAPAYWSTRTENESRAVVARNMARYINWQGDGNDFSFKHVLANGLPELYVTGRTVKAIHYRRDVRPFFFGRDNGRLQWQPVTFARGPLVEHVPREFMLWDTRCRIGDAPFVARLHEWSWAELRSMAKLDDAWDRAAVESVKGSPGADDYCESQRILKVKDDIALRDSDATESAAHGVWEIHVDWSMLGSKFEVPGEEAWGGEQLPLVVHLHARTGTILRLTGSPYLLPYKPFVDLRWRHGDFGVAKALEQMQAMQTTVVNQMFDAQTRANAIWAVTRNPKHITKPFDPSRPTLVDAMDELAFPTIGVSVQPNLASLTMIQTIAERWMGASDPLMGRDTRSGGHPAPATSTLALLEQVNVMSAGTDVMMQEELSRLGEAIAILDQQFETNEGGKLQQILGAEDAASVGEYLFPEEPIPGNYDFDVVALSRTENPDSRMRRALMVAQAYQNYAALTIQGAQILDMPPNQVGPKVKATWTKIMDGYSELLSQFLDASNIDDSEKFLVNLQTMGVDARNAFRQFAGEAAQAAQASGGGTPNGGPGALSATGSLVGAGGGAGGGEGRSLAGVGVLQ